VLVGIPLGVIAARQPAFCRLVFAATGILQTIPSLALLLFMIPIMMWLVGKGTGAPPAIAALFLYSLLPIMRNTHAGLTGIPASLRESAEALGLPPLAVLWRVELPLAAPTILAGVRTAAVINVHSDSRRVHRGRRLRRPHPPRNRQVRRAPHARGGGSGSAAGLSDRGFVRVGRAIRPAPRLTRNARTLTGSPAFAGS
jgi:hypothetical protein